MKTKNQSPFPGPINCECGGHLRVATLPEYDFSDYVGFKLTLTKIPGLRCDKCHGETLSGSMITRVLNLTTTRISSSPRRLHGAEARYLRKTLGVTQEELATRMGINRVTVAKWECGDEQISPQHDYILRGMILAAFTAPQGLLNDTVDKTLRSVFGAVRNLPPTTTTVIDARDLSDHQHAPARRHERRAAA